jgi:hypothetical protein
MTPSGIEPATFRLVAHFWALVLETYSQLLLSKGLIARWQPPPTSGNSPWYGHVEALSQDVQTLWKALFAHSSCAQE